MGMQNMYLKHTGGWYNKGLRKTKAHFARLHGVLQLSAAIPRLQTYQAIVDIFHALHSHLTRKKPGSVIWLLGRNGKICHQSSNL